MDPKPLQIADEDRFYDCIHCGLCLNNCPTYVSTGHEMDSPRGRIHLMKALQEGRVELTDTVVKHLDRCLDCQACTTACPSGVQYKHLIEPARFLIEDHYHRAWYERWTRWLILAQVLPYPARTRWALWPVQLYHRLGGERWLRPIIPRFLRPYIDLAPTPSPRGPAWPTVTPAEGTQRGRVAMLTGCVMDVCFRQTNAATVRVLARNGFEVVIPPEQVCCGSLLYHSGMQQPALELARQNIAAFAELEVDAIVINSAGCGAFMRHYDELFPDQPAARRVAEKVRDVSEFLHAEGLREGLHPMPWRVTYHEACHLGHAQGVTSQPVELIKQIPGLQLVPLPEVDMCCGSAGSYNMLQPAMATLIQQRKLANILKTGAQWVVTGNPGCLAQIENGLKHHNAPVRVIHTIDLLDRAYSGRTH